ncbi:hypothetical protein K0B04_00760 [Patescibacteria group bacterium]|nr:hypothetical protein [Patescibacteria group bacterium]
MNIMENIINPIKPHITILGVTIVSIFILYSLIFGDSPKKAIRKLRCSLILSLVFNVIFFLFLSRFLTRFFDNITPDFEIIAFSFLVVLTLVVGLRIVLEINNLLPKTKRGGDVKELYKEVSQDMSTFIFDISLIFISLIIPTHILGNGSLDGLMLLLFLSVLINYFTFSILFSKILDITEKIFE